MGAILAYDRMMRPSRLLLALLLPLALLGCSRGSCHEACARVSECKRQKALGDRVPGENKLPPDPVCMERCEAATPEFAACEGKRRECEPLLRCIPYH